MGTVIRMSYCLKRAWYWILLNAGDAMSMQSVPADSYRLADLDADGRDELLVQRVPRRDRLSCRCRRAIRSGVSDDHFELRLRL